MSSTDAFDFASKTVDSAKGLTKVEQIRGLKMVIAYLDLEDRFVDPSILGIGVVQSPALTGEVEIPGEPPPGSWSTEAKFAIWDKDRH